MIYLADARKTYESFREWIRATAAQQIQQAEQCCSDEHAAAEADTVSVVDIANELADRLQAYHTPDGQILSREDQIARNAERAALHNQVAHCALKLGNVFRMFERRHEEDNGLMEQLGQVTSLLAEISSEAVALKQTVEQELIGCRERLAQRKANAEIAMCQQLHPVLPKMSAFSDRVVGELHNETAAEKELLGDSLASLKGKEGTFLRANMSPTKCKEYQDILGQIDEAGARHSDLVSRMSTPSTEVHVRNCLQDFEAKAAHASAKQQSAQSQKKRVVDWLLRRWM